MAEALREFGEYIKQGNVPNISESDQNSPAKLNCQAGENGPDFTYSDESNSENGSDFKTSDDSNCPSTRRATQASENSDRVLKLDSVDGSDAGEIVGDGSIEAIPCVAKPVDVEGAELIADMNRNLATKAVVKAKKKHHLTNKGPVKAKKKLDLATKAAAKPKEDLCARTNSDSGSRGESNTDPNQLVKDPNQLEKHNSPLSESDSNPNQLVKDPNELVKDDNQLVKFPNQLVLRKRRTTATDESDDASSRDSSSSEVLTGKFIVSKAVKSKGRPKVRRKQVREAKRLRMREASAEANELVQGRLVPVKDLSLVRKTLEHNGNVADALPVLNSITPEDSPTWKATSIVLLARKQKVHRKVTIVFPKNYVAKCMAGIKIYRKSLPSDHHAGRMGVSISKMGTFAEEDLKAMLMWHDEYPKLVAVHDLAEWIRVSKFTRISLPSPLNHCTTVDLKACAARLESISVTKLVSTRSGQVQVHELAFFRRSEWLDDSCFKIVMSHLIDQDQDKSGRSRIGGVNPLYARVHDESMKQQVIANSPCQTINRLVLIPMYLESHWAGVVLDYEKRKATMFDPAQTMTNYKEISKILDKYLEDTLRPLIRFINAPHDKKI
ncbi:hypothetical protein GN958_ATG19903 [Phytophthora infestans]|nr:hypothetical protein GN958_ATG19903 [Phytophthora infestans]